uniref:DNA polymerase epsilon subunit 3 n=1 Tax=Urocitellus parryii TaxID=9999 RepID=A0A8D2GVL9_UROPR
MSERPEDLNLPNAVITRIIKEALPDSVNISKEARSAISCASSVFVLYTTCCANNFAMNASDVLSAMEEMEFQRFITPLKEALEAYRREQKGKKEASEQKKKDKDKKQTQKSKTGAGLRTMKKMRKDWKKKNRTKKRM